MRVSLSLVSVDVPRNGALAGDDHCATEPAPLAIAENGDVYRSHAVRLAGLLVRDARFYRRAPLAARAQRHPV